MISGAIKQSAPPKPVAQPDIIKLKCASCQTPMRVPLKVLASSEVDTGGTYNSTAVDTGFDAGMDTSMDSGYDAGTDDI